MLRNSSMFSKFKFCQEKLNLMAPISKLKYLIWKTLLILEIKLKYFDNSVKYYFFWKYILVLQQDYTICNTTKLYMMNLLNFKISKLSKGKIANIKFTENFKKECYFNEFQKTLKKLINLKNKQNERRKLRITSILLISAMKCIGICKKVKNDFLKKT